MVLLKGSTSTRPANEGVPQLTERNIYSNMSIQSLFYSHVHTRVAGSGLHLPSAPHSALILPAGTNPGLHLKNISASSVVIWYASMEPLPGTVGSPQLAEESRLMVTITAGQSMSALPNDLF